MDSTDHETVHHFALGPLCVFNELWRRDGVHLASSLQDRASCSICGWRGELWLWTTYGLWLMSSCSDVWSRSGPVFIAVPPEGPRSQASFKIDFQSLSAEII